MRVFHTTNGKVQGGQLEAATAADGAVQRERAVLHLHRAVVGDRLRKSAVQRHRRVAIDDHAAAVRDAAGQIQELSLIHI